MDLEALQLCYVQRVMRGRKVHKGRGDRRVWTKNVGWVEAREIQWEELNHVLWATSSF